MATYISMLRGINVSGQKKINMQDLKGLYEELNFRNIKTYIQSGNVVFEAEEKLTLALLSILEQNLLEKYGFTVPVILKKANDLEAIITGNPFLYKEGIDTEKLHITFLQQSPLTENLDKISISDFKPDEYLIAEDVIYLYCPNGYGRTKLTNTFFENKLKVLATTRNWRTANELLKLARLSE
jgi:uncharacterized protein (DUF1697 family)